MFAQSLQFSLFDITGKWNQIFSIQTKCISIKAEIHELQIFTRTLFSFFDTFGPGVKSPAGAKYTVIDVRKYIKYKTHRMPKYIRECVIFRICVVFLGGRILVF